MWSDTETDKKTHRACSPKDSNRSGVPTDFENRCYKASSKLSMEDKKHLSLCIQRKVHIEFCI